MLVGLSQQRLQIEKVTYFYTVLMTQRTSRPLIEVNDVGSFSFSHFVLRNYRGDFIFLKYNL